MPDVTLDAVIVQTPGQLVAEVEGELVMMSLEQGEYYGLDAIATDIWRRLAQPVRVVDLVHQLTDAYEGDPDVIAADLCRFLTALAGKGLVEVRE